MTNPQGSGVVSDIGDPTHPHRNSVTGEQTAPLDGEYDILIDVKVDRAGILELADMFEKTGNPELIISARRLRNAAGAPQSSKAALFMNKQWKVKHTLIVAAAASLGITANELIGRWRQRKGHYWPTFGEYRRDAPVVPIRRASNGR